MLIWDSGYQRVVDAVGVKAVLPVAGSVVGAADDESVAPDFLPAVQQPAQAAVHITQRGGVAFPAVRAGSLQGNLVGIMDGGYVQIKKDRRLLGGAGDFF